MSLDPTLAQAANSHLVPASFAEKAMASLMQLHEDLCAEKEKRVDLYRQLMEKEQALAELAMYVRILEERLEPKPGAEPLSPERSGHEHAKGAAVGAKPSVNAEASTAVRSEDHSIRPADPSGVSPSPVAPRPPQVAAGPARAAAPRLKSNDWKVW